MKKSIGTGRGSVYTIILKALQTGDKYGYEICKEIEEKSNGLYILKQPSLYSGLKRLEAQKDVYSYWGDSDIGGRRHYYSLTEKGKERIEKSSFSWEDSRADFIPTLFEKSEEEKTVDSLKEDVSTLSKDISEIQQINEEMEKQLNQTHEDKTIVSNVNTIEITSTNTPSDSKIARHTVSPLQQDLFSFVSFSSAQQEEIKEELQENLTEKTDDNQEKIELQEFERASNEQVVATKESEEISNIKVNEIIEEKTTLFDFTQINEEKEIENINEIVSEKPEENKTENINENNIVKLSNIVEKNQETADLISPIIEKNENNFVNIKAEESIINVNDYLNLHTSKTIFDEEIKRDVKPITKDDLSESINFLGSMDIIEDKEDKEILIDDSQDKAYEEYLKALEDEEENLIKTEQQTNQNNNIEHVNSTTQVQYVENTNNQIDVQQNSNQNYNQINFGGENQNSNDYSNVNGYQSSNNQVSSNSFSPTNKINNTLAEEPVKTSNLNNQEDMNLKEIFGDFIQEKQSDAEQVVESQPQPQTTEMFREYNNMNFKASEDLPRVDVSNNINLTLKSDKTSSTSTFKSYHDDDDYESVRYDYNNQNQQLQPEIPTYSQNFCDIPFDQKYSQSQPVTEDYTVRKYRKIDDSALSSKYLNYSKLHAISCFFSSAMMFVLTLIINIFVGSVFKVNAMQQMYLIGEYILCGILLIYGISYQLLNKNKRIISSGNKMQYIVICVAIILMISILLMHIITGSIVNIFSNYATFIIPMLYLISIIVVQTTIIKIKKTNLLYR